MSGSPTGRPVAQAADWIDVTVPLWPGLVHWPGDPPFAIDRVADMARGDVCNVSRVTMSVHAGTHVDAPLHFVAGGQSVSDLPVEALLGPARVVAVADEHAVGPEELSALELRPGERVLLRTCNSQRPWADRPFNEHFVHVTRQAAKTMVAAGIRTVGVDYLSVGAWRGDGVATHRVLLQAGIWIIEGLDLSAVRPGDYELCCLPLRIVGADGSPARALLRPR